LVLAIYASSGNLLGKGLAGSAVFRGWRESFAQVVMMRIADRGDRIDMDGSCFQGRRVQLRGASWWPRRQFSLGIVVAVAIL